jgi:hypothetical protein
LTPATLNTYAVPFVRPVTVYPVLAVPVLVDADQVTPLFVEDCTDQPVIVEPLLEPANQVSVTCAAPLVPASDVAAAGEVNGVIAVELVE